MEIVILFAVVIFGLIINFNQARIVDNQVVIVKNQERIAESIKELKAVKPV